MAQRQKQKAARGVPRRAGKVHEPRRRNCAKNGVAYPAPRRRGNNRGLTGSKLLGK